MSSLKQKEMFAVFISLFFFHTFKAIPTCVAFPSKKEEVEEAMSCAQKPRRAEKGYSSASKGYR